MKKTTSAIMITIVLFVLAVAPTRLPDIARAQTFTAITIKADGSIDPPTAPITRTGNTYTLTGDIAGSLTVEKFNIVIDGAGHTVQGNGTGRGIQIFNPYNATVITNYDVTIKNFTVKGFEEGIDVFGYWGNIINGVIITQNNVAENGIGIRFSSYSRYSNNTIVGNSITANSRGIALEMGHLGDESGNIIRQNQIKNNEVGLWFMWLGDVYGQKPDPFYMNNRIFKNVFLSNFQNVVNAQVIYFANNYANIWDNGAHGNYWSDYKGTDANGDGIGDVPYVIDEYNVDSFPLMDPEAIFEPDESEYPVLGIPPKVNVPEMNANATISRVNQTLWVNVDAEYKMHAVYSYGESYITENYGMGLILYPSSPYVRVAVAQDVLEAHYPIPLGATNITVLVNGEETLVQQDVHGYFHLFDEDLLEVNWTVSPVPCDFVVTVHYEHPVSETTEAYAYLGEYAFPLPLYGRFGCSNISYPLYSWYGYPPNDYKIHLEPSFGKMQTCLIAPDGNLTALNADSNVGCSEGLQISFSRTGLNDPFIHGAVVVFSDESEDFPVVPVAATVVVVAVALAAILFFYLKKRTRQAPVLES